MYMYKLHEENTEQIPENTQVPVSVSFTARDNILLKHEKPEISILLHVASY